MFDTIIIQPVFNLLSLIYALIPGHNFGQSIILFTIAIRILLWPLVKKQLHHTKAMRDLQPELKRIKQATKGNRQQESMMVMQLYKERGLNPFAPIGLLIVQLPILIALYSAVQRIVSNPQTLTSFSYPFIQSFGWMQQLAQNINLFDGTLFGVVDLTRAAIPKSGGVYWPALILVIVSAALQYIQSKQLMPTSGKSRGLKTILKDAGQGKQADQSEVNAAVGRTTRFLIPAMIFIFTVGIASALSLYFVVSGLVAILQQRKILATDETEMEQIADEEIEIIPPKNKKTKSKKRRKKR